MTHSSGSLVAVVCHGRKTENTPTLTIKGKLYDTIKHLMQVIYWCVGQSIQHIDPHKNILITIGQVAINWQRYPKDDSKTFFSLFSPKPHCSCFLSLLFFLTMMRVGKKQRVLQSGTRRPPNPPSCGQNVYYKNNHIKLSWIWMNVFFFVSVKPQRRNSSGTWKKVLPKIRFPWIKDINNLDQTCKINHKIFLSHLPFSFSIFPGKFVLSHVWLSSIGLFLVSISGFQLWYKQQSSSKENIALPFFLHKGMLGSLTDKGIYPKLFI